MELKRAGSQPSMKGPADWFTGTVRIDHLNNPPGHRHWHWHGASPTTAMTHIAIQESLDGKNVEWMEHVTDEQYLAGVTRA